MDNVALWYHITQHSIFLSVLHSYFIIWTTYIFAAVIDNRCLHVKMKYFALHVQGESFR